MWVLGMKPFPRVTRALNHWATFPVPCDLSLNHGVYLLSAASMCMSVRPPKWPWASLSGATTPDSASPRCRQSTIAPLLAVGLHDPFLCLGLDSVWFFHVQVLLILLELLWVSVCKSPVMPSTTVLPQPSTISLSYHLLVLSFLMVPEA